MVEPRENERITVMMDAPVLIKLRQKQAKEIQNTMSSVSFSRVLNEVLRKALRIGPNE